MQRRAFLGAGLALAAVGRPASSQSAAKQPRLLVVDSISSALVILDGPTFAKVGRIPLARRPREILLSPNGLMAYVAIYGPGIHGDNPTPGREIIAIDVTTMRVAKTIALNPHSGPHGMALTPDGRIWVTCENEGSLLLIDPSAKTRAKTIAAVVPLGVKGPHWVAITPDGAKVYASSMRNPVLSVVDARERRLVGEIKVPRGLDGLAIAPDGRRLFAADLGRAALWVIDVGEDKVVREFPLSEPASRLLATPDGSALLIEHEASGTIEVLDVPSLRRRGVAKVGRSPSGLTTSPDGLTAYVGSFADGTITVVDLKSLRTIRTITCGGGPDGLALSVTSETQRQN